MLVLCQCNLTESDLLPPCSCFALFLQCKTAFNPVSVTTLAEFTTALNKKAAQIYMPMALVERLLIIYINVN